MSKSMIEVNKYFKQLSETDERYIVFMDAAYMVDCAKNMVDLAGDDVSMRTRGSPREVSKEEAKEHLGNFSEKDCTPRGVQFYDDGISRILEIGRYSMIDGKNVIDVMFLW